MTVFSSLQAAAREGFRWLDYDEELLLHLVVRSSQRSDGRRQMSLALARPEPGDHRARTRPG